MLTHAQFSVLNALAGGEGGRIRDLAGATGLSTGTVSSTIRGLKDLSDPAISDDGSITAAGLKLLEPYHVTNAVIPRVANRAGRGNLPAPA